jgi:hypothetical protein
VTQNLGARCGFGRVLTPIPDLDGDGVDDCAVSAPGAVVRATEPGLIVIVSLRTGASIDEIHGLYPGDGFGRAVVLGADIDGDGVRDLLVASAPLAPGERRARVSLVSMKRRIILWATESPFEGSTRYPGDDGFGMAIASCCDCDDDGLPDFVIGCPRAPRVERREEVVSLRSRWGAIVVLSSKTGKVLRCIWGAEPSCQGDAIRTPEFGTSIACGPSPDTRQAGTAVLVSAPGVTETGRSVGTLTIIDPRTGAHLRQIMPRDSHGALGSRVLAITDVSGDGVSDYLVGNPPSSVRVLSGESLEPVYSINELHPGGYDEGFGASLAIHPDLNADGIADVVVGCAEVGDSGDAYYVSAFSGKDGALISSDSMDNRMCEVAVVHDVDGDHVDDVLLGLFEIGELRMVSGSSLVAAVKNGPWRVLRVIRMSEK